MNHGHQFDAALSTERKAIQDAHRARREARKKLEAAAPDLLDACVRMMVGITKESTPDCEWYEGIEYDGAAEAKVAIVKAEQ